MSGYIGVNGTARKLKDLYVGVDGTARAVTKAYVGDANGVARLWYQRYVPVTGIEITFSASGRDDAYLTITATVTPSDASNKKVSFQLDGKAGVYSFLKISEKTDTSCTIYFNNIVMEEDESTASYLLTMTTDDGMSRAIYVTAWYAWGGTKWTLSENGKLIGSWNT